METWNSSCIICAECTTYTWKLIAHAPAPPKKKSWLLLFQMNSKIKKAKYCEFSWYTSAWNHLVIGAVGVGKLKYFMEWKTNRKVRLCVPVWPSWSCLEPWELCIFILFDKLFSAWHKSVFVSFLPSFYSICNQSNKFILSLYWILSCFVIASNVKLGALASTSFQQIAIFYLTTNAIL